tara:strand:+ start:291 stop:1265 length:975 start_codon:yes stop_codon:yes gene_type:complete
MHERVDERHHDLVTGAAGFIGSALVERLLDRGGTVTGIDNLAPAYDAATKLANVESARGHPLFRYRQADLLDMHLVDALEGVHTVYHLAGQPGVQSSWGTGFGAHVDSNVLAAQHLLEACLVAGVQRVVLASSSSVYGNADGVTTEVAPTRPMSPYGVSKLAGELLAAIYADRGLDVVVLRYFTVYGPRQRPDMAFHRLFVAAAGGPPFPLRGDGSQRRSFTFVEDVVSATLLAGEVAGLGGQTFNLGGGAPVALVEVIERVGELVGRRVPIEQMPRPPGDPELTHASTEKLEAAVGWRPTTGLDEGLVRQAAWHCTVGVPSLT